MERILIRKGWKLQGPDKRELEIQEMPSQVHDILLDYELISNPNLTGINKDQWIGEKEWCYRTEFEVEDSSGEWNLRFQGLDTFVDIYLNNELAGENKSVYMPLVLEKVSGMKRKNILELRVKPPRRELEKISLLDKYKDRVPEFCKARVFRSGYHEFSGPKPDLIRMGVYGDIYLEKVGQDGIREGVMDVSLREDLEEGYVRIDFSYFHPETDKILEYRLTDMQGRIICEGTEREHTEHLEITVPHPRLWWPRSHGEADLYHLQVTEKAGEVVLDTYERQFGFRKLEKTGDMEFTVNGKPLRLWGANLVHADTMTGCYSRVKDKLYGLLDLAEMGHFNCLRIWGESEILGDDFYDECDRRGILLWHDFYLGFNMYSEEEEMLSMCRQEAEYLVKRLKHHPSILLWCGGNEMYWSRDMQYEGEYCFGEKIFCEVFPEVCRKLDPERDYHITSPSGGEFSNDPAGGDTHGYTHLWFVPGRDHPVFLSENCRVSAPELKTLNRMMTPEELWPAGYQNISTKRNPLAWPETWSLHNTNDGAVKLGPVEHYYDAENAEELIYRIGMAHSEYIRKDVERFRRGRSETEAGKKRQTNGHLLWKFNNNSNIISYGVVDYFNEPMRAYYALKRAYEPFQISFSIGNHITLWAVNDTVGKKEGSVRVQLFSLTKNRVEKEVTMPFSCGPDESVLVGNLDVFGQLKKDCVLAARAVDEQGEVLAESVDYVEMERRLSFPDRGQLSCRVEAGMLVLESDTFARCVELRGGEDGLEFGWLFEDNYFDLLPGVEKKIKVYGKHEGGAVQVKPYYWGKGITVDYTNMKN